MVTPARWKKRAQALVDAVRDVAPADHPPAGRSRSAATSHRAPFDRYVKALRNAKAEADDWRDGIISAARSRGENQQDAELTFKENFPVGTVAFGRVIEALRRFWLEAAALNKKVDPAAAVAPEEFLLSWLMDGTNDDLAEFLSALPFWPIGLTEDGKWS
ncbi:MAG TPA: hypothetical protein VKW04_05020 [Planctomycetota bacterium]|nr:hypothetical protein [Planctomycetota bacterium]